jgi:hypothetical protein
MAYIGTSPSQGVRHRYLFTATSGQTTFTGADDDGRTLSYTDTKFMDVFLNGVLLDPNSDYTATTGSSVVLTSGAATDDLLEVIAFDTFSVFSGTFGGDVTVGGAFDATTATFDRASTDGTIIDLQKDSTSVGSIGAVSSNLVIGTGSVGLRFYDGGDAVIPHTAAGGSSNGLVDLGQGGFNAFKDLYLSGGAYLGGTGAANYLDDYEEGTWTPVLKGGTTIITHTVVRARYIKIGNQVQVSATINVDGTGSGNIRITGLPFQGTAQVECHGSVMFNQVDFPDVYMSLNTYVYGPNDVMEFYGTRDNASWVDLAASGLSSSSVIQFTNTYIL